MKSLQTYATLLGLAALAAGCGDLPEDNTVREEDAVATVAQPWAWAPSRFDGAYQLRYSLSATTSDVTSDQARAALAAAAQTWSANTSLSLIETPPGDTHIMVTFASLDGPGGQLAQHLFDGQRAIVILDNDETWSVAPTPPTNARDLRTTLLHELGHALGLTYSSVTSATMSAAYVARGVDHTLHYDDRVAIRARYPAWASFGGNPDTTAWDIDVSPTEEVWIVSAAPHPVQGNYLIKKLVGTWQQEAGFAGAVRIAVSPQGIPWVITAAGEIYVRTSKDPATGTWQRRTGCGKEIGIGANGDVWLVGCTPTYGGYFVHKWNGTSFVRENANAGAVRIAVGPTGIPWVVPSDGSVWRRRGTDPASGSWEKQPDIRIRYQPKAGSLDSASDIGVGPNGDVYVLGKFQTDPVLDFRQRLYVLNEQPIANPAPGRWEWVQVRDSGGSFLAVGPNGPWTVATDGSSVGFRPYIIRMR